MSHPLAVLGVLALAGCGTDSRNTAGAASAAPTSAVGGAGTPCAPLETREANAAGQEPAFPGQTRACPSASPEAFTVSVVARGLVHPWAIEPLPDGQLLVTERPGRLRVITAAGAVGSPITGVPAVAAEGQGGLLDVALSPAFASDRRIYLSYSEPRDRGNGTSVARGVLSTDRTKLEKVEVIFRSMPSYAGDKHFGSRLVFGPDGMLYVTLGERSDTPMRLHAQDSTSHLGKIVRIAPDGSVPPDNPWADRRGGRPEVWSLGHRNVQAAAFDAQGQLWVVEHGTHGGDELNRIVRGRNYGWPIVAYGEEYSGAPIAGAVTARHGYEQPVYYWDPVIAPSGALFYSGAAFPEWKGSLFVGSLRDAMLVRLSLANGQVTGEEHLLKERAQRVRDVAEAGDGSLYLVTDAAAGEVWRIAPR